MPVSSNPTNVFPSSPPDSQSHPSSTVATAISVPADEDGPLSQPAPHLAAFKWFDNVIFELNGVFLQSPDSSKVDKRTKGIRYDVTTSLACSNFERGLIGLDECRAQISAHFEFSETEVADAVDWAMSWQPSSEMVALATELQSTHNLYAIGNLPQPVFDGLKESIQALNLFKKIFVSSSLNERLPHPAILTKALASAVIDPKRTLYIGNHIDNVITARSFGFHSIRCVDPSRCIGYVRQICREPIAPAKRWLKSRAGALNLETSLGITVKDAYMQLCILDATGNISLIYYDPSQRLFSWYDSGSAVPECLPPFPPDVDCNSLAYSVFPHLDSASRQHMMDKMLLHVDSQGILQGYLSPDKVRLDVLMCVNGLALFHEYGRGHQLAATETWLYDVLVTRAFRDGTHYYPSPDLFLYFVSRLLRKAPTLRSRFAPVLRECVLERTEADGDALALAARLIAAARCGVVGNGYLLEKLLVLQKEDGSWEAGVVYRFNRTEGVAWHQGFTVALAVLAIEEWDFVRRR